MPEAEVKARLADGRLVQGKIRINAKRYEDAYIPSHGRFPRDIFLGGVGKLTRRKKEKGERRREWVGGDAHYKYSFSDRCLHATGPWRVM